MPMQQTLLAASAPRRRALGRKSGSPNNANSRIKSRTENPILGYHTHSPVLLLEINLSYIEANGYPAVIAVIRSARSFRAVRNE